MTLKTFIPSLIAVLLVGGTLIGVRILGNRGNTLGMVGTNRPECDDHVDGGSVPGVAGATAAFGVLGGSSGLEPVLGILGWNPPRPNGDNYRIYFSLVYNNEIREGAMQIYVDKGIPNEEDQNEEEYDGELKESYCFNNGLYERALSNDYSGNITTVTLHDVTFFNTIPVIEENPDSPGTYRPKLDANGKPMMGIGPFTFDADQTQ